MKVFKLTSVAFALASLSLVASCADEEESLIVKGAPVWQSGCTVKVPAQVYLTHGKLDLRFGTEYLVPLELKNQLQQRAAKTSNTGTDTSEFQVVGADVTISSEQNPKAIQDLSTGPDGDEAYVDFSPPIPTNSIAGNGSLGMIVTGIPASTAERLGELRVEEAELAGDDAEAAFIAENPGASELEIATARARAEAGVLQRSETFVVSIIIRARRTGNDIGNIGEIEAREFRFPVDVCYGCLVSCGGCEDPGRCPSGSLPVDSKDRLFMGDFVGVNLGCGTAQDDYITPVSCG